MIDRIKKHIAVAGLALAAATMAFAQHLDPGVVEPVRAQTTELAAQPPVRIGEQIDPTLIHPVSRPGLYGVSSPPDGSRYGVIDGRLIRYDDATMQVQSIIRPVDYILD